MGDSLSAAGGGSPPDCLGLGVSVSLVYSAFKAVMLAAAGIRAKGGKKRGGTGGKDRFGNASFGGGDTKRRSKGWGQVGWYF